MRTRVGTLFNVEDAVQRVEVSGCTGWQLGSDGPPVVFVTGPPMSGRLFRNVQARLAPTPTLAVELLSPGVHGVDALARRLDAVIAETGAVAVVAHGLAVPVVLQSTSKVPVVLTNGTLTTPDPVLRSMGRLGTGVLSRVLFRPEVLGRWMPSSAGLRRLVSNPYVMNRDIVVMLLEPVVESAESRRAAAEWVCDVARGVSAVQRDTTMISAIWGDNDPLCPLAEVRGLVPPQRLTSIPGGRHLHPEERPWELADRLRTWLEA